MERPIANPGRGAQNRAGLLYLQSGWQFRFKDAKLREIRVSQPRKGIEFEVRDNGTIIERLKKTR